MITSIITLSLIGFAAGFLFSVPVAGPLSALVVHGALENRLRYVRRAALGGSIIEFFYVFVAMFGITYLMKFYRPFIPYLFIAGGLIIFAVARKIYKTVFNPQKIVEQDKSHGKGGFRTGAGINITNPTLFFGWITTSFIILTFASSIGLNTGGLELIVEENVNEISHISEIEIKNPDTEILQNQKGKIIINKNEEIKPVHFVLLSFFYALAVSAGSFVWFFVFSKFINKHRGKINPKILNTLMKVLGVFLFGLGIYFIYMGIKILV